MNLKMNLPNKFTVTVTEEDIKNGKPMLCTECPISLAAQRVFPSDRVATGGSAMFINGSMFFIPKEAMEFIMKFDEDKKVEPFTFEARSKHAL